MKRSPLKRKTPLRKRSPRKAKERADYARVSSEYLKDHPNCEIGPVIKLAGLSVNCWGKSTHVHHMKGRGRYLCDTDYFLASCSGECHPQWIHKTHVKEARELGLLL